VRRTLDGRHTQTPPRRRPESRKSRADRPSTNPLDVGRSIPAYGKTHKESQKPQIAWALFAIQTRAYPRPKNASQNVAKHGRPAKQRLRDPSARSVRGGRMAPGPPSIRVPLNRGDTHAGIPAESIAGTSKGRHDEPAHATFNARSTAASFGCGSIREGCADQSIHGHRGRDHRGSSDRSRRGNRGVGFPWRVRRPRQGLSPEGPRPRGLGAKPKARRAKRGRPN
jgi:hypothetical protein